MSETGREGKMSREEWKNKKITLFSGIWMLMRDSRSRSGGGEREGVSCSTTCVFSSPSTIKPLLRGAGGA